MDILERLKRFAVASQRVLRVTKKPSRPEFQTIVKVSGIGILLIGFIGFLLQMVKQLMFR